MPTRFKKYIEQPTASIEITPSTEAQTIDVTEKATANVAAMTAGAVGVATVAKGEVIDHAMTITPQVAAGTAGYNAHAAYSGESITVRASEVASGEKTTIPKITSQNIDVTNYATNVVNPIYADVDSATTMDAHLEDVETIGNMYRFTGTTDTKYDNGSYYINCLAVIPTVTSDLTYTGETQSPTITNYDSNLMTQSGPTSAINAGEYTLIYTLNSGLNWTDGTSAAKTFTWSIARKTLAIPTVSGTYTYTGEEQTVTINNFDATYETVSGNKGTNAGNYTAVVKLKDAVNTQWTDETTADRSYPWTIKAQSVTIPTVTGIFEYDTTEKAPTITGYDSTKMTKSGTESATIPGTYTITFELLPNYKWSDDTTGAKSYTWLIKPGIVTIPTVTGSYTYDTQEHAAIITGYDSTKMTKSGTESATNAGTYTITFELLQYYKWSDETTEAKLFTWTIAKAASTMSVEPTTLTYTPSASGAQVVTATVSCTGTLSCTPPSGITTTIADNQITCTWDGSTAIADNMTVSFTSTDPNYDDPESQTVAINASTTYRVQITSPGAHESVGTNQIGTYIILDSGTATSAVGTYNGNVIQVWGKAAQGTYSDPTEVYFSYYPTSGTPVIGYTNGDISNFVKLGEWTLTSSITINLDNTTDPSEATVNISAADMT